MGVFYFHQPFNMSNVKTPESLSCFGELCFNRKAMKEYLDEQTFNAMIKVLDEKEQPSSEVIDSFAQGVLRWAAERGCTHITHVFQPLSGIFALCSLLATWARPVLFECLPSSLRGPE